MMKPIKVFSTLFILILINSADLQAQQSCSLFFTKVASKIPIIKNLPIIQDTIHIHNQISSTKKLPPEDAYFFGPEFTFTNLTIVAEGNKNPTDYGLSNNPIKAQALNDFWSLVKNKGKSYPGCSYRKSSDKHGDALEVRFENGYYFTIGNDSCVIEVNGRPETINGFSKVKHYLDEFVFDLGKQLALEPHERTGQGQIHVSRQALEENARLLRNGFVEFQNKPEIIFGALGNHLYNSPPLSAQKVEQRVALRDFLYELDSKDYYTIEDFVNGIHQRVYTSTVATDWGSPQYYQAFNMTRLLLPPEKATLEIRSLRPQRSTREYELQTKLIATWIEHLKKLDKLIEYNMSDRYKFSDIEIVDGYYKWIEELKLPWNDYKELLPPNLVTITPSKLTHKKEKGSRRR